MADDELIPLSRWRWRVGRSVGRTVYLVGDEPSDVDRLIGLMDTPELAELAVNAVNRMHGHDA